MNNFITPYNSSKYINNSNENNDNDIYLCSKINKIKNKNCSSNKNRNKNNTFNFSKTFYNKSMKKIENNNKIIKIKDNNIINLSINKIESFLNHKESFSKDNKDKICYTLPSINMNLLKDTINIKEGKKNIFNMKNSNVK